MEATRRLLNSKEFIIKLWIITKQSFINKLLLTFGRWLTKDLVLTFSTVQCSIYKDWRTLSYVSTGSPVNNSTTWIPSREKIFKLMFNLVFQPLMIENSALIEERTLWLWEEKLEELPNKPISMLIHNWHRLELRI